MVVSSIFLLSKIFTMESLYMYLWGLFLVWVFLFQWWFLDFLFQTQKAQTAQESCNRFELVWASKIFTPTEQKFFYFLKQAIDTEKYCIFTKVRLIDIIFLKHWPREKYVPIRNQIIQKHLDFVITDNYGKVVMAIELDDKYHSKEKVKKNDEFKDDIFQYMWIPLERFQVGSYYDFEKVKTILS